MFATRALRAVSVLTVSVIASYLCARVAHAVSLWLARHGTNPVLTSAMPVSYGTLATFNAWAWGAIGAMTPVIVAIDHFEGQIRGLRRRRGW